MTRRDRLMSTIKGEKTDRPPVCFYGINGLDQNPDNKDRFNIYNDPSWYPLIKLAREKSDRIVLRSINFKTQSEDPLTRLITTKESFDENGNYFRSISIKAGNRILTRSTRRDPDIDTVWTLEHPVKDIEDFKAWIDLPQSGDIGEPDIYPVLNAEKEIGDSGIVAIDIADPLCEVAELFDMGDYTVMAMTEPLLFHKALGKVFEIIIKKVEAIARALPNRLWRICGPEYACPPYLPPKLFKEYVVQYDKPLIEIIKNYGGFPRIHCHGRIKEVLDDIVSTGCIGIDPVEPPPHGNVSLVYVRKNYGDKLVLFGNIELADIENMETHEFEKKVVSSLEEGTYGEGKGFVLMPTAAPIGRKLKPSTLKNYEKMIEITEHFA
jgi:hypothetical protein